MSLLAVGVSHQTAPVALLEQFAMGADETTKALHELVDTPHVSEAIVLATCNRVEVFAEVDRFHGGVAEVSRVLARQAGATVEELSPYVTVHYEDEAVRHLFTVAAGLDSMVVGETQVLGQLRNAYALAREQGTVGRALHPVAQRALRVGKRVHSETGIDRAGASLVSVSLDRAEERIGPLAGRGVLVVGAGSMGALAATTLARRGAGVTVISRTPASAQRLADAVEGRAAGLGDLTGELAAADVLVTCTGARGLVVGTDVVSAALTGRTGRPLVVVDLALPRDVDPGVAGLPGVHVVDLALLQSEKRTALLQSEKRTALLQSEERTALLQGEERTALLQSEERTALLQGERGADRLPGDPVAGAVGTDDIASAHALIEAETALLRAERQAAAVAPTVSALRSQAAEVVDAELLRLSARVPDLDAKARAEVARTVRRVVDKLLHEPTVRVKELAGAPGGVDYADALRALFGLGIDAEVVPERTNLAEAVTVDPDELRRGGSS
ncbi:glutamyl-tRNA reductase [Geodermatophilus sp. SYSU D00758]